MFTYIVSLFAGVDKTKLLNTFGLWILIGFVGYWTFLREDPNKLNQETVTKLVLAVDKFAEASESLTVVATKQKEWSLELERRITQQNQLMESGYSEIYRRYEYDPSDSTSSIDDLYAGQLRKQADHNSGGQLRGDESGTSETPVVQNPATGFENRPH